MDRISSELIRIANQLDDLELHSFASKLETVVGLVEAQVPSKQPQIQGEPIIQDPHEVEAEKEFKKDIPPKKKDKRKGIIEGRDLITNTK